LSQVVVYPNPFRADRNGGEKRMVFMGLTPKATIRIYNVTGQLVRTLEKNDSYAVYVWDLNNSQGTAAASGIYLYLIKSDQGEARGKLAILR
jgi:flagellar hook assembly protein FlgD